MRFRSNKLSDLSTPFVQETGFDELQHKWPHDAEHLGDENRYAADEKAIVPLTGRVIRASHFNEIADAIVGVQHYIKNNAGKQYLVEPDGTTSLCSGLAPLRSVRATWSSHYTGTSIYLSRSTTTITASLDQQASGVYNFEENIEIPSEYGPDPFSSNNFGVIVQARLMDGTKTGWWSANSTGNINSQLEESEFIFLSYCPDISTTDELKVYGKVVSNAEPSAQSENFTWPLSKSQSLPQILIDPDAYLSGYAYKPEHPAFSVQYATQPGAVTELAPRTGSLNRVEIKSCLDWGSDQRVDGSNRYPYIDSTVARGAVGGILVRDRTKNPDPVLAPLDVSIEFMFHGYDANGWTYDDIIGDGGGWLTKSGVFLRMTRSVLDTGKDMSIDGNFDYSFYPHYTGYLLRFNSNKITSDDWSPFDIHEQVGTWAIMKVRYEQFGAEYKNINTWWDRGQGTTPPATGQWIACEDDSPYGYDLLPSGEVYVLAYSPEDEHMIPVIGRNSTGNPIDEENRYLYRFGISGNVLTLEKKLQTASAWTTVLQVTDPDPILPVPGGTYFPSGLYCKGTWGTVDQTNSGRKGRDSILSLSNIKEYVEIDDTSSKTIKLDCLFFGLPDNPSVPTVGASIVEPAFGSGGGAEEEVGEPSPGGPSEEEPDVPPSEVPEEEEPA